MISERQIQRRALAVSLKIIALAVIIATAFSLAGFAQENEAVQAMAAGYGYAGAFAVALLSGFNLLVPVPAAAFVPLFKEAGMNFYALMVIIAVGVTCADFLAYLVGKVSKHAIIATSNPAQKISEKLDRIRARFAFAPYALLFLFASFVPLPNEVLLVPMGALGYRLTHVLPIVFSGNLVFNILYSTGLLAIFESIYG